MITLMDFYADWCGPCHVMKPILEKVLQEYGDKVELVKINVDEDQARAQEYGVMSIPTLVLIADGQEKDRKIGAISEDMLSGWLSSYQ